jgi:hypothetical protein
MWFLVKGAVRICLQVGTHPELRSVVLQGNPRDGKLMRVAVDDVTALVLLCAGGEEGDACALSLVERLDPPSVGVPLKDAFRLQLAVTLAGAAVHFCGSTRVRSHASQIIHPDATKSEHLCVSARGTHPGLSTASGRCAVSSMNVRMN